LANISTRIDSGEAKRLVLEACNGSQAYRSSHGWIAVINAYAGRSSPVLLLVQSLKRPGEISSTHRLDRLKMITSPSNVEQDEKGQTNQAGPEAQPAGVCLPAGKHHERGEFCILAKEDGIPVTWVRRIQCRDGHHPARFPHPVRSLAKVK
jgi:hypothetical protein